MLPRACAVYELCERRVTSLVFSLALHCDMDVYVYLVHKAMNSCELQHHFSGCSSKQILWCSQKKPINYVVGYDPSSDNEVAAKQEHDQPLHNHAPLFAYGDNGWDLNPEHQQRQSKEVQREDCDDVMQAFHWPLHSTNSTWEAEEDATHNNHSEITG